MIKKDKTISTEPKQELDVLDLISFAELSSTKPHVIMPFARMTSNTVPLYTAGNTSSGLCLLAGPDAHSDVKVIDQQI